MINRNNSLVLMIDMQERLVLGTRAEAQVEVAEKLIKAAEILKVPVVISEQYPKGLGSTFEILKCESAKILEKTTFSFLRTDGVSDLIKSYGKKQVILFGIEAHICVYQTAMDLLEQGYEVYLIADASKSRKDTDFNISIELMRQEGVKITCLEIVLFEMLEGSKNPNFKEIQQLIK